jgi:nitroimidazol reductase NimA-like FMN-containing flavoprotein (pyridoxamine 5'-phosphate oxidase superfamily)
MSKKTFRIDHQEEPIDTVRQLLTSQQVAVLSTHNQGQPYGTLVGFSVSPNLKSIFFATTRTTRKFANIVADDRVAMTFDDRTRGPADFYEAVGVTACGRAAEVSKSQRSTNLRRFLAKHPHLKDFVMSPNCAFLRVRVDRYVIVQRFQDVIELVVS